ncbi:DNA polymerase III subunit delta [Candidatus Kuenenbacteria bacterium CG11_big_fil_rev_8_21_14_0_20_37_9]|uniref:DNA polymerase III subunit delta n=1 Tax=Candidatus Kuenenbacteria bacterium CG08_land_8_20_14_0_20_37_23 TaxID=1974617 RepID=A0A2M6XSB1_9BACT|nr:MAG: DNA polymerase III subunit delta [Candidatus Kuenenbacteria bacterium CG11_big_fil_rev_8_21_14_0_20_37_9]PIU10538.1 MAG: DNA polymerase III subunit delta [Candidatus Kuenenbacteria bacterium CG08_land_8_20_14_0_20_37_23]
MIIFLYGQDTFRSKEKLRELKNKFIREIDKSGLNLIELDGEKININDFNKAVSTQSFLSKRRMIVIRNIFLAKKAVHGDLLEFLKSKKPDKSGDENIIIFFEAEPDKRTALFKYLNASKFKEEFKKLENNNLINWITKRVSEKGGKINGQNADYLASKSDGNLWALASEIDKLIAQKKDEEIGKKEIEESPLAKIADNIFNLTDAIAKQDKKLALRSIDDNLEAGMNEMYLLSMIVRQFRIIVRVKTALLNGLADNQQIAKKLGFHPFVVQKAMPQVRLYNMEKLKKIYEKLLATDLLLKSSDLNKKAIIENMVVKI